MKKRLAVAIAALLGVYCLGGCGSEQTQQETVSESVQTTEALSTEVEETEASSTEVQETKESAILVVSFGTSFNDSRDITIGAIETAITNAFPDYEVRRAFTSQIIIDILGERDSLEIDNVTEALDRALADGVKELIVQPTHLMNGYEYNDLAKELVTYVDKFEKIVLSEPLLISDSDFDAVIKAITEKTASYDDGQTAICFMGHGTEADSNAVYAKLQNMLTEDGYENYYVGTVEAAPSLDDVITALNAKGTYKKVILEPLMVVAGDHANNDMAGEEEDSWKTILTQEGYEVECVIEGLGQIPAIQDLYVEHTKVAIEAGVAFSGVAEAEEQALVGELTDGTYAIEVESSSSMFKVEKAELIIADGNMTAVITLGGTGYAMLYMGNAEQAVAADEADCIPFVEDADGAYTYTIPVEALDQPISCAAFSTKKEEWYDRQLTFLSASIQTEGTTSEAIENTSENSNLESTAKEDGTYTIEVTLEGGSGKSTIVSPATIKVKGDNAMATIQWTSPNYDYMLVNDEKYLPINTEGDSVFEIPILVFDEAMPVIGDTVAMSKPHEVEYTITFHSETMKVVE